MGQGELGREEGIPKPGAPQGEAALSREAGEVLWGGGRRGHRKSVIGLVDRWMRVVLEAAGPESGQATSTAEIPLVEGGDLAICHALLTPGLEPCS